MFLTNEKFVRVLSVVITRKEIKIHYVKENSSIPRQIIPPIDLDQFVKVALSRAVCHPDRPCQKCKDGPFREMITLEISFQNRERVQRSRYTKEAGDEYFLVR